MLVIALAALFGGLTFLLGRPGDATVLLEWIGPTATPRILYGCSGGGFAPGPTGTCPPRAAPATQRLGEP